MAGPVDRGTEGLLEAGTEGTEAGPVLKGTDGYGTLDDDAGREGTEAGGEDAGGTEALELLQGEQSNPTL